MATNYDRIIKMSVEELATFLEKNGSDDFHEITDRAQCRKCETRNCIECPYLDTYGVKEWLESEVE